MNIIYCIASNIVYMYNHLCIFFRKTRAPTMGNLWMSFLPLGGGGGDGSFQDGGCLVVSAMRREPGSPHNCSLEIWVAAPLPPGGAHYISGVAGEREGPVTPW